MQSSIFSIGGTVFELNRQGGKKACFSSCQIVYYIKQTKGMNFSHMTTCNSCFQEFDGNFCPYCGGAQNEEHQLPVGTVLHGRYQIGKVLGQGGFGITYMGRDRLLGTIVAVKEFFPGNTVYRKGDSNVSVSCINKTMVPHFNYTKERFLREASALLQFKDLPEVVNILDFSEENNTAYIVMEFVKGIDLAKYVRNRGGRLTVEETFRILRPVMEALTKIHKAGVIHRDISPDNIILDPMGGAKLLDFGAVRVVEDPNVDKALNRSTEAILKHGFAPIEQYNTRGSLGPWTDEYALCATIWYCLTGTIPEDASIRMSEGADLDWISIPGLPQHQQAALIKGSSCRAKDRYPGVDGLLDGLFPDRTAGSAPDPVVETRFVPAPQPIPQPIPQPDPRPVPQPVAKPKKKSGGKGKLLLSLSLGIVAVAAAVAIVILTAPARKYAAASRLQAKGQYAEAIEIFTELGNHSDSKTRIKECNYAWAEALMEEGYYQEAIDIFTSLKRYEDSADRIKDCRYAQAEELLEKGDLMGAASIFAELGDHSDAPQRCVSIWAQLSHRLIISQGDHHTLALLSDGTVVAAGSNADGQCNVDSWSDIVAICAGDAYSVGLKKDGTVVATGNNEGGQCDVGHWSDIVEIRAGFNHTVGLRKDGTVISIGNDFTNNYYKGARSEANNWSGIVAIEAGGGHTVGLKADGTVLAVGYNEDGECNVEDWTDIVAIAAGTWHTVGLRKDGTVVAVGYNNYGQCEVESWTDIVAIAAGKFHTVGLKKDGTVVAVGKQENGLCDVDDWTDIVAICAGENNTAAVKSDGTVIAVGMNDHGQCKVTSWKNVLH